MMDSNILIKIYKCFLESNGISTDTRNIKVGELFFALKGPNFNANSYAGMAIEKGASFAVIDDVNYEIQGKTLLVEDVLVALQQVATHHRSTLDIPVIGLTGSNGKTTTKELMHLVLKQKYRVYSTAGNLNNHIGVPLTVLRIPQNAEIAIIELGANHIGEIGILCQICQPSHGLITNVGRDHLEGFGSFEGSLRANSELYEYLINQKGKVFVNALDPILLNMSKRIESPVYYPDSEGSEKFLEADPFVKYINKEGNEIETQLIGEYNFANISAAVCVGDHFEVNNNNIDGAITSYVPDNNRSQWVVTESNQLLMDAYNANPSSMEVALKNFSLMSSLRKVVILGDMYELGNYSKEEHQNVGLLLDTYQFDDAFLVGEDMKYAKERFQNAHYFEDKKELVHYLESNPIIDSTILLKASRGIKLETLTQYL